MAYVLVLAIVALEVPLAISLNQRIEDEVRLQATSSANIVAVLASDQLGRGNDLTALQELVAGPARQARGRVVVVDRKGIVRADSAGVGNAGRNFSDRPEIKAALTGRPNQFVRESESLGRDLIATAVPIVRDGRTLGAVRITQDVAAEHKAFRRALAGLILIGVAVLAVGLLIGAVIAQHFAKPLRRFEETARAIGDGDLEARAPVEGSDEQRSLATSFNEMTDRLAGSLRAQSRFVADASHQLRTPLTGLRLRLEEAAAKTNDPAVTSEIDQAIAETDRLSRTVDELLVLSQTGERDSRVERLDLVDLATAAHGRWLPYAHSSDHQLDLSTGVPATVDGSRADIDRVIDALIENAINYSPPGSVVRIGVDDRVITVRDQGPGLSDDEAEMVFDRFHRGHAGTEHGGGTGLGLAIARELAGRWGGEVTLANA
ncbi:MAG TPA: ATP-binding protein, partial [Solirubrobacterales bacterium]|nr:ATP-binding protein [Solirubrobacterales bacterium]